jgi:hypothetical protein
VLRGGRVVRLLAIVAGAAALAWHPSANWIEHRYVNGMYPVWERAVFALTSRLPWSLGDAAVLLGIAGLLWRAWKRDVLGALAILAIYGVWFEAAWGWNYNRAPIETRTAYNAAAVNPAAVNTLRLRAVAEINRLAPIAHRGSHRLNIPALYAAWLPVVQAGGDTWTPLVGAPKPTLADPFMAATGTSGFVNPLTLNVQLASDLFWFERPFALAHEWSHVAGFAREDEANYISIVSCIRSTDPAQQYSGWLELFLYLPRLKHYPKRMFVPLVWSDFRRMSDRDKRRINVSLAQLSWRTYNVYLKSNHVAAGVLNYDEVTKLYLGIPRDKQGIPMRDSGATPR